MTEEALADSVRGRLERTYDGDVLTLVWHGPGDESGKEMVRFDPDEQLLRIFPTDQFSQVRELQIDTSIFGDWDDVEISEDDRGQPQLAHVPDGFGKIFAYGLGLKPKYRAFIHYLQDHTECTVVRFGHSGKEGPVGEVFHVSLERFERYTKRHKTNRNRGQQVVSRVNEVEARNAISGLFGLERTRPVEGRNSMIRAMTRELTGQGDLNPAERERLVAEMSKQSRAVAVEQPRDLGKLRQDLELVSLDVLIDQFEANLRRPAAAKDEKVWQKFFENNVFALQQLFTAPVSLHSDRLEAGLPSLSGQGTRIPDFCLLNTVTRSAVLVEIKTPATTLLGPRYRGTGSAAVYPPDTKLSGSVAQLQAQIASVRTDVRILLDSAAKIDNCVVSGTVIVGMAAPLDSDPARKNSFLRFREGLSGLEVITFDEVLDRLKVLHAMLTKTADDGWGSEPARAR